jgi:hypothetical protein
MRYRLALALHSDLDTPELEPEDFSDVSRRVWMVRYQTQRALIGVARGADVTGILAEWLQDASLRSSRPCRDDYDAGVSDECGRTVLKLCSILNVERKDSES